MRIVLFNPNSTGTMTEVAAATARRALPSHEVLGWTSESGPPAIQGAEDGAAAVPGVLAMLPQARAARADVIIIACFDDTGLAEAKAAAHCPVIGIGEAAYHAASLLGRRFSVVTTLPVSIPVLEENLRVNGLAAACARVRASGVPVLDLEAASEGVAEQLAAEIRTALDEDGIGAVVLGCAGMAGLSEMLRRRFEAPLIDPVEAAAHLALAAAGIAAGLMRNGSDAPST